MITVTDLKFLPLDDIWNSPYFTCCQCGTKTKMKQGVYAADYDISDGTGEAVFTFVCCSDLCVIEFNSLRIREHANKYINDRINEAIKQFNNHIL